MNNSAHGFQSFQVGHLRIVFGHFGATVYWGNIYKLIPVLLDATGVSR